MDRIVQQIKLYMGLTEMRLFWYFLPLALIILVINFIYLPIIWIVVSLGILLVLGIVILINNLRLARLNLEVKVERNELQSIIFNLFDGVIAYDQNFRVLIFNRSAERIFGIKAEQALNQIFSPDRAKDSLFSLLCMVLFPSLAPSIKRHSDAGVYPQIIDMSFTNPHITLRVTTDKIVDPSGRLLGFVKIVNDRTREMDILRSKNEFIEVAAHQLRTPLTSINWIFESLVKETLPDTVKEMVDMGQIAAGNLLSTVNDLLDVTQMEEGKYGYKFQNADLTPFVENILSQMMASAKEANVNIYLKKSESALPAVFVDPQKLSIAFSNLISNAIKYNVDKGEVIIELKKLDDKPYIQVSVKDTGIGVPSENMKQIFDKFFRADNAQKTVADGTGLGLHITKNIIKAHGGEIWAESQLNRGSTFYFTLPTDFKLIPQREDNFV